MRIIIEFDEESTTPTVVEESSATGPFKESDISVDAASESAMKTIKSTSGGSAPRSSTDEGVINAGTAPEALVEALRTGSEEPSLSSVNDGEAIDAGPAVNDPEGTNQGRRENEGR